MIASINYGLKMKTAATTTVVYQLFLTMVDCVMFRVLANFAADLEYFLLLIPAFINIKINAQRQEASMAAARSS